MQIESRGIDPRQQFSSTGGAGRIFDPKSNDRTQQTGAKIEAYICGETGALLNKFSAGLDDILKDISSLRGDERTQILDRFAQNGVRLPDVILRKLREIPYQAPSSKGFLSRLGNWIKGVGNDIASVFNKLAYRPRRKEPAQVEIKSSKPAPPAAASAPSVSTPAGPTPSGLQPPKDWAKIPPALIKG